MDRVGKPRLQYALSSSETSSSSDESEDRVDLTKNSASTSATTKTVAPSFYKVGRQGSGRHADHHEQEKTEESISKTVKNLVAIRENWEPWTQGVGEESDHEDSYELIPLDFDDVEGPNSSDENEDAADTLTRSNEDTGESHAALLNAKQFPLSNFSSDAIEKLRNRIGNVFEGSGDDSLNPIPIQEKRLFKAILKAIFEETCIEDKSTRCGIIVQLALQWKQSDNENEHNLGKELIKVIDGIRDEPFKLSAICEQFDKAELQQFADQFESTWRNLIGGSSGVVNEYSLYAALRGSGYSGKDLIRLLPTLPKESANSSQSVTELIENTYQYAFQLRMAKTDKETLSGSGAQTASVQTSLLSGMNAISSVIKQEAKKSRWANWRVAVFPLALVQKAACIYLGRLVARASVEAMYHGLSSLGCPPYVTAAIFAVPSATILVFGYLWMQSRSSKPFDEQTKEWRFSAPLVHAGTIAAISLSVAGPMIASYFGDATGTMAGLGGPVVFVAATTLMQIIFKYSRQLLQTGTQSGILFPSIRNNSLSPELTLKSQVYRDVAGVVFMGIVTTCGIWAKLDESDQNMLYKVATKDFYVMLHDFVSDDPTEWTATAVIRLLYRDQINNVKIKRKDVPNPLAFDCKKIVAGLADAVDQGNSRVINGFGDWISFAATGFATNGYPGVAIFFRFLNLLVQAPLKTRRSTLLNVIRHGKGNPGGLHTSILDSLATCYWGYPVNVDGSEMPTKRPLTEREKQSMVPNPQTPKGEYLLGTEIPHVGMLTLPSGRGEIPIFNVEYGELKNTAFPVLHQFAYTTKQIVWWATLNMFKAQCAESNRPPEKREYADVKAYREIDAHSLDEVCGFHNAGNAKYQFTVIPCELRRDQPLPTDSSLSLHDYMPTKSPFVLSFVNDDGEVKACMGFHENSRYYLYGPETHDPVYTGKTGIDDPLKTIGKFLNKYFSIKGTTSAISSASTPTLTSSSSSATTSMSSSVRAGRAFEILCLMPTSTQLQSKSIVPAQDMSLISSSRVTSEKEKSKRQVPPTVANEGRSPPGSILLQSVDEIDDDA